jgi:hypothetical protein
LARAETISRWLALAAALGALLLPRAAHAFERQWHVGGGVGFTSLANDYKTGPALGLNAAYGLSDMFDVRLELLESTHVLSDPRYATLPNRRVELISADAGLTYKLDVLQWIPYGGLLIGYRHAAGVLPPTENYRRDDVQAAILLGLDYSASRSFGLGLSWRGDSALSAIGQSEAMTLMLRAEYHWGF